MSEQAEALGTGNGEAQKQGEKSPTNPDAEKPKNGVRGLNFNVGEPKSVKLFLMVVAMSVIALIIMVVALFRIG